MSWSAVVFGYGDGGRGGKGVFQGGLCSTFIMLLLVFFVHVSASALILDESPAEPGSWGFRPADGTSVFVNPPAFTWRPHKNREVLYALQVAKDADFANILYQQTALPWSTHCPAQVFPAGVSLYWRYRAQEPEGRWSDWSTVRRMTIAPEATAYPKPERAALAARIPKGHPRLFFLAEEIDFLREQAKTDQAELWTKLREKADALLATPPDTTEPPRYPEGVKYKGEEWKKIWWGNRRRAVAVADGAALLAFVYALSGEKSYGEGARELLLAFCEWDPKGATNYEYNDEAAMPLLYYPSRTYSWIYDLLTPEQRSRVISVMRQRGQDCYQHLRGRRHLWRPYASHSNRAWHWLGEVAIAFHGEIPESEEWLDYSMTLFYSCYPVWGGNDGGWHEGMAYWESYLSRFMNWALVSRTAFQIDPFEKPFFRETGYYGMYTLPPGTQTGAFGDLAFRMTSHRIAPLMSQLAVGANNRYWCWYADKHRLSGRNYLDFVFTAKSGSLTAEVPEALPSSRCFKDTGLAVLNTNLLDGLNNVQVHFKSSPFGRQSHGYNANNAFLLNVDGAPVFIRSGHRDVYGSPHHAKWMFETKSDNAILINGKGQRVHTADATGQITEFHTQPQLDVLIGEAGDAYEPGTRWTRRIFFFKPSAVLIHDVLEAPEPAQYQWLLHATAPFELGPNYAACTPDVGKAEVRFLRPLSLNLSQKDVCDPPPYAWSNIELKEWHLTAETTEQKAQQEFITLITVKEAPATAITTPAAEGVRVVLTLPEEYTVLLTCEHAKVQGKGVDLQF